MYLQRHTIIYTELHSGSRYKCTLNSMFTFEALSTLIICSPLYQGCFQYFIWPISFINGSRNVYNLINLSIYALIWSILLSLMLLLVWLFRFIYLLPSFSTFFHLSLPFVIFLYLLSSFSTFCHLYLPFAIYIYILQFYSTFCRQASSHSKRPLFLVFCLWIMLFSPQSSSV